MRIFKILLFSIFIFSTTVFSTSNYISWYEHEGYLAFGIWNGWDYVKNMCRHSVDRLEKIPSYKIGFNIGAQTFDYDYEQGGELIQDFKMWFSKYPGRIGISGGDYAQPLSSFTPEESLLRHFFYGLQTYEKHLNYRVKIWQTSENGNTPQLPQILKKFGYKGALFRTHFTAFGGVPEFDCSRCKWIGPDETEIDSIPTYKGQSISRRWLTIDGAIMSRYNQAQQSMVPNPIILIRNSTTEKFLPDEFIYLFYRKFERKGIKYPAATKDDDKFSEAGDISAEDLEKDKRFKWCIAENLFEEIPDEECRCSPNPEDFWTCMPWGSLWG